jgi:hypothetical protein
LHGTSQKELQVCRAGQEPVPSWRRHRRHCTWRGASRSLPAFRRSFDVVEAALDTGHEGFALLLDEAQVLRDDTARAGEHPMSMLIAAVNGLQEAGLPLALVVCGLPTLRGRPATGQDVLRADVPR